MTEETYMERLIELTGRIEALNDRIARLKYVLECAVARIQMAENREMLMDARFMEEVKEALR